MYIPFVRDSGKSVTAVLSVSWVDRDTTYRFAYAADYKLAGYDSTSTGWNVWRMFSLFGLLNHKVFGYTQFLIKDTLLASAGSDSMRMVATLVPNSRSLGTRTSAWYDCMWWDLCPRGGGFETDVVRSSSVPCPGGYTVEICVPSSGGGGSPGNGWVGTGGGTGDPSGGGGGNGGWWTGGGPQNCDPTITIRGSGLPPCEAGWLPLGPTHAEGLDSDDGGLIGWDTEDFPPQTLPTYNVFDANYPKDANGDELDAPLVYQMAGGPLYNSHLSNPTLWSNACALRVSIALVKSGINIPHITRTERDGTITQVTKLGAGGKYYFTTATELHKWMSKTFGTPPASHIVTRSEAPDGNFAGRLPRVNGIYILRANYPRLWATGHATIFQMGNAMPGADLYGTDNDVTGGIYDVTVWQLQ